jgi:hypothetical protein
MDLRNTSGTNGMALREQPTRWIYGDLTTHRGPSFGCPGGALATWYQAKVFTIHHLGYRKAVVQLHKVDILWCDAGHVIGTLRCTDRCVKGAKISMPGDAGGAAGLHTCQHIHW